jgi:hypothetical protein
MNSIDNKANNKKWSWDSLDPLTKTVVATFSGRIGDKEGDLPAGDFVDNLTEAFPLVSKEDVAKIVGHFGIQGMQRTIVNQLAGLNHENVTAMTNHLGVLAGEPHQEVADLTGVVLKMPDYRIYEAVPALTELSELAVRNLVSTPTQN